MSNNNNIEQLKARRTLALCERSVLMYTIRRVIKLTGDRSVSLYLGSAYIILMSNASTLFRD